MQFRSRLRRGISLEVIFEEEHMRPANSHQGSAEVSSERSRSPDRRPRRAPSLSTLNEEEYFMNGGHAAGSEGYPSCWDDDDFGAPPATISRRQILGLRHLHSTPDATSGKDAGDATRRWVDAHSPRRRPLTVGELRDRHRHPQTQSQQPLQQQERGRRKHRGTDYLGGYRAEDLLVNDNIVIVDTTPPTVANSSSDEDRDSPVGEDLVDQEVQTEGDLPPPQTVRKVADRFEKLAKAEPDSYLIWRDTSRLSGIRTNPSSKILRWDPARDTAGDQGHRLFQQELHELFRARRAAANGKTSKNHVTNSDIITDVGGNKTVLENGDRSRDKIEVRTASKHDDNDEDVDSLFSSDEGDQSCSSSGGGAAGVRTVSSEALDRIRRQGLSITYHGTRTPAGRPSLGQLVAAARRQPTYVAVATATPRVVDYLPKLPASRAHTLPSQKSAPALLTGSTGKDLNRILLQEVKAATLRPRSSPKIEGSGWRQTGRCYVYDFSHSNSRKQTSPADRKPSQAT